MALEPKNITAAYRCPVCGTHVVSVEGILALTGNIITLKCPCGESFMTVENLDGERFRLHSPCVMCEEGHDYVINKSAFSSVDLIVLDCPYSGISACAVGKKEKVLEAMQKSDEDLMEIMQGLGMDKDGDSFGKLSRADTSGKGGYFEGGTTLYDMAKFFLGELVAEGNVECHCGGSEGSYDFELLNDEEDSVRFFCRDCGSSAVYPANELFYSDGSFRLEKIYLL